MLIERLQQISWPHRIPSKALTLLLRSKEKSLENLLVLEVHSTIIDFLRFLRWHYSGLYCVFTWFLHAFRQFYRASQRFLSLGMLYLCFVVGLGVLLLFGDVRLRLQ